MARASRGFARLSVAIAATLPLFISSEANQALSDATMQSDALTVLKRGELPNPSEADVLYALDHGWWDVSKELLRSMRLQGGQMGGMQDVRTKATKIRDQATEIINLMRTGANAEETVVNAAFQWAQRPEFIYLNIKFSSRIDGPVTVLNVDNEKVVFGNDSLTFEALGRQKPKTFKLNLTFNKAILPEQSFYSFASVGRISVTIAKAVNETWPRLLLDKKKPKNMYSWYDRQTALDADVKKEKDERVKRAKEEKEAEEKAEKEAKDKAGQPSTPPVQGEDETPAAESTDTPAKPKKKGKKKKSKKQDKTEL